MVYIHPLEQPTPPAHTPPIAVIPNSSLLTSPCALGVPGPLLVIPNPNPNASLSPLKLPFLLLSHYSCCSSSHSSPSAPYPSAQALAASVDLAPFSPA